MKNIIAALLCLLLLGQPVSAAGQTCIIVHVIDEGGAAVPAFAVKRSGAETAKLTDASGTTLWCVGVSQTSTSLSVNGIITVASAVVGTVSVRGGVAYVAWIAGTDPVHVTITVAQLQPTATPSNTPGPSATLYPTMTAGPSPTQRATHAPNPDVPHVVIKAERITNIPGRTVWTYWPGGGATVVPFSADADAWIEYSATPYTLEASGDYVVWYVTTKNATPDLPPSPPQIVTRIVTATPGAATATATRTALPTIKPTPPDAATWQLTDAMTLDQGAALFIEWAEAIHNRRPWVIQELGR